MLAGPISLVYHRDPTEQAANQNSIATLHLTGDATLDIPLVGKPPLIQLPPLPCRLHPNTCQ